MRIVFVFVAFFVAQQHASKAKLMTERNFLRNKTVRFYHSRVIGMHVLSTNLKWEKVV